MNTDLRKVTRDLWEMYVLGEEENSFSLMQSFFDDECVIIGTGRHEFYQNLATFQEALSLEIQERQDIQFQFKDFWCDQKQISEDVCFVYGQLHIYWQSEDQQICINMHSRFTTIYHLVDKKWKIVHIHQSMPNLEQEDNEFYPKTLTNQLEQSNDRIEELTVLAKKDSLTHLINFRTFKELYENWNVDKTWLFMLDIDKFKQINDQFGHLTGNKVLQVVATTLEKTVRHDDVVCRMGGDEFIVLCNGFDSSQRAEEFASRVQTKIAEALDLQVDWFGMSIGKTKVNENELLEEVIARADANLYEHKKSRRNRELKG